MNAATVQSRGVGDLSDLAKRDYLDRVNRAIDHVTANLSAPLRLEDVSRVACFSPFHFHRIFRAIVGETLHDFVKRVRLERAMYLISHTDRSLTDIALSCGFSSSSDFSRQFRQRFGVSPRKFDIEGFRRANREQLFDGTPGGYTLTRLPPAKPDAFTVHMRQLPARRVAYRRIFRPFDPGRVPEATAQLVAWARERDLHRGQWLGYMWDDPAIVPLERCRYDMGLEIPETVVLNGDVSEVRLPPMTVAEVSIAGSVDLEVQVLEWLYTTWLPHSGFAPDDQPRFEAFNGEPYAHGDSYFELRVHLPVVSI